jgi:Ni2+-binding GTPase involved in maturation of urease and hydrogenase
MNKTEIIETTLQAVRGREAEPAVGFDDISSYERHIIAELQRSLDPIEADLDIPICANFAHLGVECCSACHNEYPEYELALVEIESGGKAWLCCSLDRALNPSKHAEMEKSPEWRELVRLFGSLSD